MAITVKRSDVISDLSPAGDVLRNIVASLQNGEITVFPFNGRYVFIADAFNYDAVKKIQFLRNTPHGTSLQVMVASRGMASGVTQKISPAALIVAEKYWPGPLTILAQQHLMLNWNLGDEGVLNYFAIRIPEDELLRELISQTGPIVIANANYLGKGSIQNISQLDIRESDVAYIVDDGILESNEISSTVIADRVGEGVGIEYLREGAIPFSEIKKLLG